MNDRGSAGAGWFDGLAPGDLDGARERMGEGEADAPAPWPALAVDSGAVDSVEAYYEWLHDACLDATRHAVRERERADDQQLKHAIRAMDDAARTANELAERVEAWAGTLFDDVDDGVSGARRVAELEPDSRPEKRAVSLARRVRDLDDERAALQAFVETEAPAVAPNLSEMAGPVLATRLVALAGGLEALAKMPSGTVQLLGAEDALFAHLRGHAPSPKHGVIFTHEFVRGTPREHRGSAARALAGKLTLAARVDHYAGERRDRIHEDLADRMATIRARSETADDTTDDEGGSPS